MARFYENSMNQPSRPTARPRMTSKAGGTQDSGAGQKPQRPISQPMPPGPPPFPMPSGGQEMPYRPEDIRRPRFGGSIPSPRQSYDEPSRRPSSAGGDRDAMIRAYMTRPEMGSTAPGEGMNRPAMDINDAFFGPDRERFDVVEFLMGLMGRR